MNTPTLFDPSPPDPMNDAAPSGNGASVTNPAAAPKSSFVHMPPVRRNAPETSRIAARQIAGHAPKQREPVLAFILSCGERGATDAEIAVGFHIPIQSADPRRGELARDGRLVLKGKRRPTPSSCAARVWVAAEFAPKPATTATETPADAPHTEGGAA